VASEKEQDMKRVIVGVDGSPQSTAALRAAAREATCRDAVLEAVYIYATPHELEDFAQVTGLTTVASSTDSPPAVEGLRRERDRISRDAHEHARGLLRGHLENAGIDLSDVELTVIADEHPAKVLRDLARSADLLVVGSRGLGAIRGRLLGSVSQQCVLHAPCSVLVVRVHTADEREDAAAASTALQT
jgi:nucleotide-binding universal stress UspA family protein